MYMKKYIKLLSIDPLFEVNKESKKEKGTLHFLKNRVGKSPLLTVDKKDQGFNAYNLVTGYPYYYALCDTNPDQMILCNVITSQHRNEQLFEMLEQHLQEKTPNENILHYLIWELIKNDVNLASISRKVRINQNEIRKLAIEPNLSNFKDEPISQHIIILMNTVCKSRQIPETMKETLYNWALYPKNEQKPLTIRKIKNLESIFANIDPAKVNIAMIEAFVEGYVNNPSKEFMERWTETPYKEFYIP